MNYCFLSVFFKCGNDFKEKRWNTLRAEKNGKRTRKILNSEGMRVEYRAKKDTMYAHVTCTSASHCDPFDCDGMRLSTN